ncbi:unnamed protein product [Lactuca saligna]|uniref:Uncharacterized protein n=1 Tax=Lactuca saligna TaxID=75948 RepID=A0AA36EIR1_LACSI|nr:unnamed protein product [Lactuca saligna]
MKKIAIFVMNLRKYLSLQSLVTPSTGLSRNVQTFCDQYAILSNKVVELENIGVGVRMVPKAKLNDVKGELVPLQVEKVILQSKLADHQHLEEEIALMQCKVASLELEKTRHVDKIDMLEHDVKKLKSDHNISSLRNTNL